MNFVVLSFSHKNTDIALRQKLALSDESSQKLLAHLLDSGDFCVVNEAILLSTCNRLEVFMLTNSAYEALQKCLSKIAEICALSKEELEGRADTFEGYGAIHHIFLVASSLESLALGETQIAGQLKKAYRAALNAKFCTTKGLGLVIDFALKCAAQVRTETGISQKSISIASLAVANAKKLPLRGRAALVIGLGEMGRLTIKHLLTSGFSVKAINRDAQKAAAFAAEVSDKNLSVGDFGDLEGEIHTAELVFCATAAPGAIITQKMIKPTDFTRYFFDLALPRDIEDIEDSGVKIFPIDDLKQIADENLSLRKDSLNAAYTIVGDAANEFFKYLNTLSVQPIIKILRQFAKSAAQNELNRAIDKGFIAHAQRDNVEKLIHNVFNVFLHAPTKNLKEISSRAQIDEIERVLKILFDISDEALSDESLGSQNARDKSTKKG